MDRKGSASSAAAMGEVVGDDSMVVGKGIMIKGDVDDCAVSQEPLESQERRGRTQEHTRGLSYVANREGVFFTAPVVWPVCI